MAKRRTHSSPILSDQGSLADKLTDQNTYADVGTWESQLLKTKRLRFVATTNDLLVQILGSLDDGLNFDVTVVSEFAVNVGTPVVQTVTDYVTDLKVQVKPAVADTHGTLATKYAGASL